MSNSVSNLSVCGCCGNKNASPSTDNVQGLSALRYRIGTHESFKKEMLDAISDADALSKLTTRYDDDLAIATLDAWAVVLDVLTFYQERICNEGYLRTAVERLSVVCLANHISYKLLPGLAAATYLAFSMNEAQGAPPTALVPVGTKVQSIPKQSQLPQVFETIEQIEARVEWNKIKPQTTTIKMPRPGDTEIYLDGIQTGLQVGDRILIVSTEHSSSSTGEEWDFRRILTLAINTNNGYTKVILDRALGLTIKGKSVSEITPFKVFAMRQKANLFGYNAPDFKSMSGSIRAEFLSQGLSASYFMGTSFNTFAGSGVDGVIDFMVSANPTTTTFPLGLNNNFSIRWSGFILPAVTGNITFNLLGADDGVRLWIDNKLIIDNWGLGGGTGAIPLQSRQLYPIVLDYFQANIPGANPARVQLQWSGPGLANQIIPANYLFYLNGSPTEWPGYTISAISSPNTQTIYLDALYPKILTGGWLVMTNPQYTELYSVTNAIESSRTGFTLTAKSTEVQLSTDNNFNQFDSHIRDTIIYAQSEELPLAGLPITDDIDRQITLSTLMVSLFDGQKIIINGKRRRFRASKAFSFLSIDSQKPIRTLNGGESLIILEKPEGQAWKLQDDGGNQGFVNIGSAEPDLLFSKSADDIISEYHTIDFVDLTKNPTVITLTESISNYFDIQTITINANVAMATHGETRVETLGSGDGSRIFQEFQLKQKPLTFISADNANGAETTLKIRVNDILWNEARSLYGVSPKDKVYVTDINDDGTVNILFGDGITGSCLPTGTGNIKAYYRTSIGLDGLLDAGQLSMLVTPQLGVNQVNNPLNTSGAQDPETIDSSKENAPLTVLTLDRIVSVKDFENFTRAFAGISKARADIIWNGQQEIVYVTAALADGTKIDSASDVYNSLLNAFTTYGHTNCAIEIASYDAITFSIDAAISIDDDYLFDDVKQKIINSLLSAFSFEAMDFGEGITPAQVIDTIQKTEGVVYVQLNLLGGQNPFANENYRLTSAVPQIDNSGVINSAQLLVIDINSSNITQL